MIVLKRDRHIGIVIAGAIVAAMSLSGCASGSVAAGPTPSAVPVEYDKPEAGWCVEYGSTLSRWGGATFEIDEPRFDEVIGLDFIGPADCYLELHSDSSVTKSVVAVFLSESPAVATFLSSRLASLGWTGTIPDPQKGGVLAHPEIGDLGYSFSASAKSKSIPVDGPATVVTLLLAS